MIAYTVTLTTQPGQRDEVMAQMRELVAAAADEVGTLVYAFHTIDDEPDTIVSYEIFADDEALAAHRASPTVARIVRKLDGLVVGSHVRRGRPVVAKGLPRE